MMYNSNKRRKYTFTDLYSDIEHGIYTHMYSDDIHSLITFVQASVNFLNVFLQLLPFRHCEQDASLC